MKRHLFLFAVCLGLYLSVFSSAAVEAEETTEPPGSERIIIGFKDEIDFSLFDGRQYEVNHIYEMIGAVSVTVPAEAVLELRNSPLVEWLEYDREVEVSGQLTDWGYKATMVPETKQWNLTGKGVKIAVIDTGISKTHPDLNVAGGASFVEGTPSYHDDNGHGTHVAGVIAAKDNLIGTVGVAPDAAIYAVKSFDKDGRGTQAAISAGIQWAIENGMDIVNLSVSGTDPSLAIKKMAEAAAAKGILVLAASGNEETGLGQLESDIMYPARYPTIISVGSVDSSLSWSDFSYFGPSLDYVAPGENVYSTSVSNYGAKDDYAEMTGTSMATPYVAGIMALYKQVYPSLGIADVKKIVSQKAIDLGAKGRDPLYGYGMITSPAAMFWDLDPDAWYNETVSHLIKENLIKGNTDGTFRPQGLLTRGETVAMAGRTLQLDGTQRQTVYKDVASSYFASGYIASATAKKIINGYPDNTFAPNKSITRGEVAVVIQKAFGIPASTRAAFSDVESGRFYYESVNGLYEAGILTGYPGKGYSPNQNITRAEFSAILSRAIIYTGK